MIHCIDATLLRPGATWQEIEDLYDRAVKAGAASVCVYPTWLSQLNSKRIKNGDSIKLCTVVSFPHGSDNTSSKVACMLEAMQDGADEIDMVANLSAIKEHRWQDVQRDVREVKQSMEERNDFVDLKDWREGTLKVIIETALWTPEEIREASIACEKGGADFVKTSTGFSTRGASVEDIKIMRAALGPQTKIKASGGIKTKQQAEDLIKAGADRLGMSSFDV